MEGVHKKGQKIKPFIYTFKCAPRLKLTFLAKRCQLICYNGSYEQQAELYCKPTYRGFFQGRARSGSSIQIH